MKNNRRNRKLAYVTLTNFNPYLKSLGRDLKREMIKQYMISKTHQVLLKMWALREKLYRESAQRVVKAMDDIAVNTAKILELHPEFLEDPAIRAGVEKTYPDLLPLQSHPPLPNDRAK